MKLVDANVLLYVINEDSSEHARVRRWWDKALDQDEALGLSWIVVLAFLRISTHPSVFPKPLRAEQALGVLNSWLEHPLFSIVTEAQEHWVILRELLTDSGTAGNLTSDAHLAALAISRGATLISCDGDFSRYPRLRWVNPLARGAAD